jgi:hypothetical protein
MSANLNQSDLAALLAGGSNASAFMLGRSHQQQPLSGLNGIPSNTSADELAAAAARNNSLLSSLLLQRQVEDQQRAQIMKQLAALNGFSVPSLPQSDNLALLLQQQQQFKDLQALSMAAPANRLLGLGGGLSQAGQGAGGISGFGSFGGTLGGVLSQQQALDPMSSFTGLLQQPASGASTDSGLLREAGSLPLPPNLRRKGRTGTFPQKLHQMLSDLERQDGGANIASFLPHGRAFAIHKPRDFVKHVMPKYFRMSRFSSFQRQLNLYDFQRITEGANKGAYFHELFVQGRPILCTMMKRNKIKGVKIPLQQNKSKGEDHSHDSEEEDEDVAKEEAE